MDSATIRKIAIVWLAAAALAACESKGDPKSPAITETLYQTAAQAEVEGDYYAAANQFRTILERSPDDRAALLGLARNLRYSGSAGPAVRALEAAKADYAADPDYLIELAKAKLALGDAKVAVGHLQVALKKDAGNWDAHATLGIAHDLQQAYGEARIAYENALRLSKDNPAILNNMAISAALAGDLGRAISTLEEAPPSVRRTPQVRQNLALLYGIKGDMAKAEGLARMDLDDDAVRKNMAIFSRFRATPGGAGTK